MLVDLLSFFKNELFWLIEPRFELLQSLNHELLVLRILPGVKYLLVRASNAVFFDELKVSPKKVDKVLEKELLVDVPPDVLGQLLHKTLILI